MRMWMMLGAAMLLLAACETAEDVGEGIRDVRDEAEEAIN